MKFVRIGVQFQYSDMVEAILDRHHAGWYAISRLVDGLDRDGKHHGSKVYPGNLTLFDAVLADEQVPELLEALEAFRAEKDAHCHLVAWVLPLEQGVGLDGCGSSRTP